MHELAQRFSGLRYVRRHASIIILVAIMGLVLLPGLIIRLFWIENGRSRSDLMVFIILPGIRLYLMLLCPLVLTGINPQLATFDHMWFNWSRSELKGLGLLPLGILLIAMAMIPFISILHLSHGTTVILHNLNHAAGIRAMYVIQGVTLTPVLEEIFWRGYIQSALTRAFGASMGIFGQAVFFALTHVEPLLGFVHVLLIGLLFGVWRHRRNTLLPLILAHILNNTLCIAAKWL